MKAKKSTAFALVAPFLAFFTAFWIIPFVYGLYISLHKYSFAVGKQEFVGLKNYLRILVGDSTFKDSFYLGMGNTIKFVICTVPLLVFLSLGLALLLAELPERLKKYYRAIYFASYSVSVTAVSATFVWLMKGNGGYMNNLLMNFGIISKPVYWLEKEPFVWITLTVATLWWTLGYNMILYVSALNEVDESMYEAATVDGANYWQTLRYITLPNIKSTFFFVLMTTIIASFNVYGQTRLITEGGPGDATKSVIMIINNTIMVNNNLGVGTAMAMVMGIIILLCTICQHWLTREKENL